MASSGVAYLTSKEGILRLIIIVFGCIAFALLAASGGYREVLAWVLAAYIIAWCCSLLSYFFKATTLATKMECGISYDTIDVSISIFSFFHCFLASIVLAMYLCPQCDEAIAADIFGFFLAILYAIEVYFLKENAPANFSYLITGRGILKALIFIFGCTTFALLDNVYTCLDSGCDAGRTWAFAAFIYCWVLSTILLLTRLSGLSSKMGPFELIDMAWAGFSFFNYLVAAIVLACYIECSNSAFVNSYSCSRRLAADIFGFFVAVLYLIDAILGKKGSPAADVTPAET